MTEQEFWALVEAARQQNPEEFHVALEQLLAALDPPSIVTFDQLYARAFHSAYTWALWGAAYVLQGGCSDDGFTYFRHGLIAAGEAIFKRAVADPDSLALLEQPPTEYEEYGYAADRVYHQKTSSDLPRWTWPTDPAGERWNFDDVEEGARRLPRLSKRYG